MMIFTHILIGMLVAAAVSQLSGLPVSYFLMAGAAGGILPDIDLLFTHRRTLHYPIIFSFLTIVSVGGYFVVRAGFILIFVVFIAAAAVHSIMDVFGGGKEMRPWRETDNRAVYNHVTQRWIRPLRIFYDGSLPDLFISITSAVVLLYVISPGMDFLLILLIVLAISYTILRRVITQWIPEDYETFSSYVQNKIR